jgi:preprotein translocase subunit SecE
VTDKKAAQESGFFQRITGGIRKMLRETVGELRKVSWPTTQETFHLTRVVVIVILAMGAVLGFLDIIFGQFFALLLSL